jgi:hypothetical protein
MGPLLELGPSSEPVGLSALALGIVLFFFGVTRRTWSRALFQRGRSATWVAACALLAVLLSAGYVLYFLRGGPRIVDATSYYLEARALAEGKLAFAVAEPTGAFRGRFSILGPAGLAVIFPPGYPLALALGFVLRAPLAVGPVLAALLVGATYIAAKELELGETTARVAALLSVLCAALRYHTADTMSHGLSALLLIASLTAALRPRPTRAALAGLLAGWLMATRPVTGTVATALVFSLLVTRSAWSSRLRLLGLAALSLVPGLALLAAHQRVATGSFFHSTQLAYYALADSPPGCFRWGFGRGIGCRFEHADFVKSHLSDGFGFLAVLYVTGERLLWHAFDVANLVLLAPLVPWVVWRERGIQGIRWAGAAVALLVLAYAPFYFPGSYPGGGARILADALPLEHVLLAAGFVRLGLEALVPGLLLLGFALSTIHAHLSLRNRDGGHPMFEQRVLAEHHVSHGLVWVQTDHGFALGHDPSATDPARSVVVARWHGDAHDLALWDDLGRPTAFRYRYSPATGVASLTPFEPSPGTWRWEAEAEWPPLEVSGGAARPDFRPCLSGGSGLYVEPAPLAAVTLELGAPARGQYAMYIGWLAKGGTRAAVRVSGRDFVLVHQTNGCENTSIDRLDLDRTNRLTVTTAAPLVIDDLELAGPVSK